MEHKDYLIANMKKKLATGMLELKESKLATIHVVMGCEKRLDLVEQYWLGQKSQPS